METAREIGLFLFQTVLLFIVLGCFVLQIRYLRRRWARVTAARAERNASLLRGEVVAPQPSADPLPFELMPGEEVLIPWKNGVLVDTFLLRSRGHTGRFRVTSRRIQFSAGVWLKDGSSSIALSDVRAAHKEFHIGFPLQRILVIQTLDGYERHIGLFGIDRVLETIRAQIRQPAAASSG